MRYEARDYKGLPIMNGATLFLSSPKCPGPEVGFQMAWRLVDVQLRYDEKREIYIVSNNGGTMGDDGHRRDEKSGALLIRTTR